MNNFFDGKTIMVRYFIQEEGKKESDEDNIFSLDCVGKVRMFNLKIQSKYIFNFSHTSQT